MIVLATHRRIIGPPQEHVLEWLGPLLLLAVIGLLVVGAIVVTRTIVNSRGGSEGRGAAISGPLRILEERFARGEIDEEEFKRRRDVLRD